MNWESFLNKLGDTEKRHQALRKAITLLRTLAQPDLGIGQHLGLFSSDPGDPKDIHFLHSMPVLHLPHRIDPADHETLGRVFGNFNRAIVIVGGRNGLLTSITVRENEDGDWRVIRIGRSHLVQSFEKINRLIEEDSTISIADVEIIPSKHLAILPLVILRMPDRRQHLLVMEVVGKPRKEVPFLFFPVYNDSEAGFAEGQALTLKDLEKSMENPLTGLEPPLVGQP